MVVLCRVSQVSCGPYHAAAIGSDGRLFTWGDGLFGKLGHGDHCSAHSPRFVTTLAGAHCPCQCPCQLHWSGSKAVGVAIRAALQELSTCTEFLVLACVPALYP